MKEVPVNSGACPALYVLGSLKQSFQRLNFVKAGLGSSILVSGVMQSTMHDNHAKSAQPAKHTTSLP
jgi:hypothetical protein